MLRRIGLVTGIFWGAFALAVLGGPTLAPAYGQKPVLPYQDLLSQADAVLKEMSGITGLPILSPVKKQVVSREEVKQYLIESLHNDYSPEELHLEEASLKAFGLVPRDFDLQKFMVDFYTEQAAGFYDPRRKTMFIADWIPPDMQKMVLSHELTHALQDQSFDLEAYLHAVRGNSDATGAREAVVEGYATAAMLQESLGSVDLGAIPSLTSLMEPVLQQQIEQYPRFSTAPFFFRFEAMFPYLQGLGFIQQNLKGRSWKDLSALFTKPPSETREIFDPAVYLESRPLANVALPQPPALARIPDLHFLAGNSLGEIGYYELIGQFISEDEAKQLVPGWRADRFLLFENIKKNNYAIVVRSRWDSAEAALSFFRDYHAILAKKYPDLAPDKSSMDDLFVGSAANGEVIVLRAGEECLWAEGVPKDQLKAMIAWLRSLAGETTERSQTTLSATGIVGSVR